MDDDELRRGLPTNHIKYGEAVAILAGDALFALAYESLVKGQQKYNTDPKAITDVVLHLSRSCGVEGMCQGQAVDLLSEGEKISYEKLRRIHEKKTGDLLIASVYMGSRIAGGTKEEIDRLVKYAGHLGIAFQIKDDILDVSSTQAELGKTPGSDERKNKATYPSIIGLERSFELMRNERDSAIKELEIFDEKADPLRALADYVVDRKK